MKWASAFKYLPINYDETICTTRALTQRVSFDNNLDGDRIRIHFSNRYGKKTLRLDRVTVGCVNGEAVGHPIPVTLGGEPVITLEPGQVIFSDEILFTVHAGERLAVNIHIDEPQYIESVCCLWSRTNACVSFYEGDQTDGQASEETHPDDILPLIRDDPSPYKTIKAVVRMKK